MFQLIINGYEVELTENIAIALNKERTNYTNPTTVRNSFSKTVTIPRSDNNNRIFNLIFEMDRVQTGQMYNPSKRTPFKLLNNGNLTESGYMKVDKVTKDNYEITLYGELGNLMYYLTYDDNGDGINLGALTFDNDLGFTINANNILNAWNNLENPTSGSIWNEINFMVAYNGTPKCDNFDASKQWTDVSYFYGDMIWEGSTYSSLPQTKTDGDNTYTYITANYRNYALFELPREITDVEARDFRSYLQRPILRLSSVFRAIGRRMQQYGYTLDLSDPFFSTSDYTGAWITLSMLYEINSKVESGMYFTQQELLSNTSAPSSYLISFCKMYSIYIDVDIYTGKVSLKRLPNFFQNTVEDIKLADVKITPLSFDKNSYTFDFADGDGEFLKQYSDRYDIPYGSKKVYTGYQFDYDSAPYIENNIFKTAVDAIEQSGYYHNNQVKNPTSSYHLYPNALACIEKNPNYKLFKTSDGSYDQYGGEMSVSASSHTAMNGDGYFLFNTTETGLGQWSGLTASVYQDGCPKVQFHSDNNGATDGKDVLVQYNGRMRMYWGRARTSTNIKKKYFSRGDTYYGYMYYLVTDDIPELKQVLGTNCYISAYWIGTNLQYINWQPSFTRSKYTIYSYTYVPNILYKDFDIMTMYTNNATIQTRAEDYFRFNITNSNGYVYVNSSRLVTGHTYAVLGCGYVTRNGGGINYGTFSLTDAYYPQSTKYLPTDGSWGMAGSIITYNGTNGGIKATAAYSNSIMTVSYIIVYDLTAMGLQNKITTVDGAIKYFGNTTERYGAPITITDTADLGVPREIFVPYAIIGDGKDIYSKYWHKYISDLYDVNTKILEGTAYFDDLKDAFRKFYWYENALWVLSSISDWNADTGKCTVKMIKVNDKNNYLT